MPNFPNAKSISMFRVYCVQLKLIQSIEFPNACTCAVCDHEMKTLIIANFIFEQQKCNKSTLD